MARTMRGVRGRSARSALALALCAVVFVGAALPALAGEGDGDGNVVTLTSKNFDSLTAEGQWLVKFYAVRSGLRHGHCCS